ncbi:MAG TPA: hypothetical protein V6C84_29995 [Coleofasciculaceae cyanobacterium]|jgi:hypothetical protein
MILPPASSNAPLPPSPDPRDPTFQQQVQRLHRLTIYSRWVVVGVLWLVVAPLSFWGLRFEIPLWQDHLTLAAVRYALIYNRLPAIGLGLCIGMTVAVLVGQSRNILLGLPRSHQTYLEKQVLHIRQQGESHPLWRWVCAAKPE